MFDHVGAGFLSGRASPRGFASLIIIIIIFSTILIHY